MAKRRNLKKEKAERNKAYARRFRKTSSRRFSRFSKNDGNSDKKQEETPAAAT